MSNPKKDLEAALAEMAGMHGDDHLSADELAAYASSELPPDAHDRAQEHLAVCRECAGLLLDLRSFAEPHPLASEFEVAKVWRGVRNTPVRPSPWLRALAAGLLIATVALSVRVVSLQRQLSRPQVNAPVQDLRAPVSRGAAPVPAEIALAPGDQHFTLVLVPASRRDFPDYEVSLSRADGREVWTGRGFEKNRFGSFTLTLPRRLAGPGEYRVQLMGIDGSRREPLGEYGIRIKAP